MVRRRIGQRQPRSLSGMTAFERGQSVRVPGPVGSDTLVPAWLAEARLAAGVDADGTPLGVTRSDINREQLMSQQAEANRLTLANQQQGIQRQEIDDALEQMERDFRLRLENSREENNLARRRQGLAEQSTAFDAKLADRRQQIDAAYRDQQLRLSQGQLGLAEREFLTDAQQNQFRNELAGQELNYRMAKDTPGLLGLTPSEVGGYEESETGLDPYLEQQWQVQTAKGLEQQLSTYRKGAAQAELTPEGRRMYGEWAGKVRAIEGQRDTLRPAQYNQLLNQALSEYERIGLQDHVMEPPTIESEMETRFKDLGNGMGMFLNGDKIDVREIDPMKKAQLEMEAELKKKGMMTPDAAGEGGGATMLETFSENPKAFEEAKEAAEKKLRAKWASRPENELKNPESYVPTDQELIDEVQRQFESNRRQWEMIRQRSQDQGGGQPAGASPASPSDLPPPPAMDYSQVMGGRRPMSGGPVGEDRLLPSYREHAPPDVNNARRLLGEPPTEDTWVDPTPGRGEVEGPPEPPPMNQLPGQQTEQESAFQQQVQSMADPLIESDPFLRKMDEAAKESFGSSLSAMIDRDTLEYHASQGSEDPVASALETLRKAGQTRTKNLNLMKPMERQMVKDAMPLIESTDSKEYRDLPQGMMFRDGEGFIFRKPADKRPTKRGSIYEDMRNPSGSRSMSMLGS